MAAVDLHHSETQDDTGASVPVAAAANLPLVSLVASSCLQSPRQRQSSASKDLDDLFNFAASPLDRTPTAPNPPLSLLCSAKTSVNSLRF